LLNTEEAKPEQVLETLQTLKSDEREDFIKRKPLLCKAYIHNSSWQ